jgi:hypothetical protein
MVCHICSVDHFHSREWKVPTTVRSTAYRHGGLRERERGELHDLETVIR